MPSAKHLLIGQGSQLASYFPQPETELISARNWFSSSMPIDRRYETIVLAFGENRTYLEEKLTLDDFLNVNYCLTMKALERVIPFAERIVVFGTSELWSRKTGPIDLTCEYLYYPSKYIYSKYCLISRIKECYGHDSNVRIIHPFNFNTSRRTGGFLFGKVYRSLFEKTKISLGNTYFYRDLVTVIDIVNACLDSGPSDEIIVGSGRLIHVNQLIRAMYSSLDLEYDEYVREDPAFRISRPFIKGPHSCTESSIDTVEWMISDLLRHASSMSGFSR